SSYYHCYATDFYLHVLALARPNGVLFPEWVWGRFSQMLEFVMHLTRSDGTMPLLGDDDGGRVLALGSKNYRTYADGLCSGAVLFARGDFRYQADHFREECFWLFGPEAWPTFTSLSANPPAQLSRLFEDSGCFIQHSGWTKQDTHVTFDCGGLGF